MAQAKAELFKARRGLSLINWNSSYTISFYKKKKSPQNWNSLILFLVKLTQTFWRQLSVYSTQGISVSRAFVGSQSYRSYLISKEINRVWYCNHDVFNSLRAYKDLLIHKPLCCACMQITTLFWHRWTLGNFNWISCIFKTVRAILGVYKLRRLEDSGGKLSSFRCFVFIINHLND